MFATPFLDEENRILTQGNISAPDEQPQTIERLGGIGNTHSESGIVEKTAAWDGIKDAEMFQRWVRTVGKETSSDGVVQGKSQRETLHRQDASSPAERGQDILLGQTRRRWRENARRTQVSYWRERTGLPELFPAPTHVKLKERSLHNRGTLFATADSSGRMKQDHRTKVPLAKRLGVHH
ncbi:hypothetical protein IW262DRAFT_1294294 [Armillaria fumosa]|nr:hypothetical protein IW262DRAFT_1294294 [Armillaria fumosa]